MTVNQDAVVEAGGDDKFDVSKAMIHAARNAHSLFIEAKEARSQKEKQAAAKVVEKRKATSEIKDLTSKRKK